jgi:hypothetical protein
MVSIIIYASAASLPGKEQTVCPTTCLESIYYTFFVQPVA